MRRIAILCVWVTLLCSTGCTIYDALFGACGTYYSNGSSRAERQYNYDRDVERWNGH
jgi:hypothetical protein